MSARSLAAVSPVLVVGALMCLMPAASRPTVQFGVRVPGERARAPVIGRERRAYYWRTAAIGLCCTAVAVTVRDYWSWWLPRIILLPELAADFGASGSRGARSPPSRTRTTGSRACGRRSSPIPAGATDPPRFPVRWLVPALVVMAATAAAGALRYPGLPAHIVNGSGHRVSKSAVSVLIVAGQLYFTAVYSGLMLIIHRSRPDIDAADPTASTLRYRRFPRRHHPGTADHGRAGRPRPAAHRPARLAWSTGSPALDGPCPCCRSRPACCCWPPSPRGWARAGRG